MIVVLDDGPTDQHPWLRQWQQFPQMRAVRNGQLKVMKGDVLVRPTPQIVQGVRALCSLLEPQAEMRQ